MINCSPKTAVVSSPEAAETVVVVGEVETAEHSTDKAEATEVELSTATTTNDVVATGDDNTKAVETKSLEKDAATNTKVKVKSKTTTKVKGRKEDHMDENKINPGCDSSNLGGEKPRSMTMPTNPTRSTIGSTKGPRGSKAEAWAKVKTQKVPKDQERTKAHMTTKASKPEKKTQGPESTASWPHWQKAWYKEEEEEEEERDRLAAVLILRHEDMKGKVEGAAAPQQHQWVE